MNQTAGIPLLEQETALIDHTVVEQLAIKNAKLAEQNEIEMKRKKKNDQEELIFDYLKSKFPYAVTRPEDLQLIPEKELTHIVACAKKHHCLSAIISGGLAFLIVWMFYKWSVSYALSNTGPLTLAENIGCLLGIFSILTLPVILDAFFFESISKFISLKTYSDEKKISYKERIANKDVQE